MPVSTADLEEIGQIKIYKRKGQKNIRLRVDNDGSVKLSLPWYVSKRVGLIYAKSKKVWLKEQLKSHTSSVSEIRYIGIYKVEIEYTGRKRPSAQINNGSIFITLPEHLNEEQKIKQTANVIEEVLRKKAQAVLCSEVERIASKNNIDIKSVKVKKLKSRWGSCDSKKNITLNLYLAHLPDRVWEYVICHELAHTKHLNHSWQFWSYVGELLPDYQQMRKELRKYSPGKLNVR